MKISTTFLIFFTEFIEIKLKTQVKSSCRDDLRKVEDPRQVQCDACDCECFDLREIFDQT